MDAFVAGVEPQHYFAEADAVPLAAFGRFQDDRVHGSILAGSNAWQAQKGRRFHWAAVERGGTTGAAYNRPLHDVTIT